jgi:hydroxyacylglutathione hydrolase
MRMATALMARLSPTPPVAADILLQDGDSLAEHDLPSVVVHTPGHTAGSCCLLLDDGVAFVGDMISAGKEPHLQRTFVDDPEALRRSYARLRGLPLSTVYSGHGDRVLTGVQVTRLIDAAYPA